MKTIELRFFRVVSMLAILLLVVAYATPSRGAVEPFVSDDFNRCSLDTSVWTYEKAMGLPDVLISGSYSGNSAVVLSVPSGQDYTFSGKNKRAPRIMQTASDTSFEVEVKFNSPLGQQPAGTFNIQGILVRDAVSVPGKTKWLRFDLNTNSTNINYYIGYFDETGELHGLIGPKSLGTQMDASPLYLRVKYDQPTGTWSLGYAFSDPANFQYPYSFQEGNTADPVGGFTFQPTGIGVFAASTSPDDTGTPAGIITEVDYFKSLSNTAFVDDPIKLTVQKVGSGAVNQQCTDNQVTLTALPSPGATFTGWSGDMVSTQAAITLPMTKSYAVTATFSGQPLEQPYKIRLPVIFN